MASDAIHSPGRILGIGGIFFKSSQPEELRSWYAANLGIQNGEYGAMFHWRSTEEPAAELFTIWSIFPESSQYFDPSKAGFMINYIVDDLDALLAKLKEGGLTVDPKREDHDYGRFAWIFDPDGNKIELWQPVSK